MKVFVYRNLHKKCLSVKALEGPNKGRVIAHMQEVYLEDVKFKVSQAGRARVLREKSKNVHAGVVGTMIEAPVYREKAAGEYMADNKDNVTYNPYKYDSFVVKETEAPVRTCKMARVTTMWTVSYGVAG